MTANKGASETRHAILREMERLEQAQDPFLTMTLRWEKLKTYVEGMAERASAKKGGLGRK